MSAAVAETVASNASRYGAQAWQAFKAKSKFAAKSAARGIRESSPSIKPTIRAPRQLTFHFGKTAGRNSAGRITIFHRGGGAKRLHRKIDLKRNTPSMGIIERIEYDPNRSARIALVRWEDTHPLIQKRSTAEGKFVPPQKSLEFTSTTPRGIYSLASLSKEAGKGNAVQAPPKLKGTYAMIGGETGKVPELKRVYAEASESIKTCQRDVFLSAFKAQRAGRKCDNLPVGNFLNFPRVTVAGAKPLYYGVQRREKEEKDRLSVSEIQKWNNQSSVWAHRLKLKAAVSWHGFRMLDSLSFA